MSLIMLIEFGDAFDFTGADFRKWCGEACFRRFDIICLAGPTSAAIAYEFPHAGSHSTVPVSKVGCPKRRDCSRFRYSAAVGARRPLFAREALLSQSGMPDGRVHRARLRHLVHPVLHRLVSDG